MVFADRVEAGKILGRALLSSSFHKPVVGGLVRGGLVVAGEVAKILHAPLYPVIVRKIRAENQPEYALGAIAPGIEVGDIGPISGEATEKSRLELQKLEVILAPFILSQEKNNRSLVLVDDGIATGRSLQAAVGWAKSLGFGKIYAAAPVGSSEAVSMLKLLCDGVRVLSMPSRFTSVGQWYGNFAEVTTDDVLELLRQKH